MKTMSTLPTKMYAVAAVFAGGVYGPVYGPYSRRGDAVRALKRLHESAHHNNYTIISTPLIWNEDTE